MKFSILLIIVSGFLHAKVKLGIDRFFEQPQLLNYLENKRIAILAHHASVNTQGEHLIDLAFNHPQIHVVKLFTPEHGLRDLSDDWIEDGIDEKTSLPYYGLYKPERRAPSQKMLEDIDVIIIDLQDVGMRFYTFATTMALTMKAANEAQVQVIILDRPNPIGGFVQGLTLKNNLTKHFISYGKLPTRHGLTMAELARFYYREFNLSMPYFLVPMEGWSRKMIWEETALKWNTPSPALISPENSYLYALLGPLESFNLAVGRGIDNSEAFFIYGAPWISLSESQELAQKLNKLSSFIKFSAYSWKPTRSRYQGETCYGVKVVHFEFKKIHSFQLLVKVLHIFQEMFQERFEPTVKNEWTHRYFGHKKAWQWIQEGKLTKIINKAQRQTKRFKSYIQGLLLY